MMAEVFLYGFYGGHWMFATGKTATVLWVVAIVVCIVFKLIDWIARRNGLL
jgi:hypothetical protein